MGYEGKKKIAVGRPGSNKKKVIFIIPGTWSRGTSGFTDEEITLNLFLANHGYDVYSMDFRTACLPNLAYDQFEAMGEDISGTADWTYGAFREESKRVWKKPKKSRGQKRCLWLEEAGAAPRCLFTPPSTGKKTSKA